VDDEPNNEKEGVVDEEILKVLRDSLKMKLAEDRKLPSKVRLNKALVATISEFMGCYRLMGYDIEGNPINLMISNNKMEQSAIDNLFVQEFGKFMSSRVIQ
jgi:hypothetical protein